MKACPICGSLTFDDSDTCFGCMHRFAPGEGLVTEADNQVVADMPPDTDVVSTVVVDKTFRFIVDVSSRSNANDALGWCCSVQQV